MLSRRDFLCLAAAAPALRYPIIPPLLLPRLSPNHVSTGAPALDAKIGGGWRRGRMTQLFGLDAVGLWLTAFRSSETALVNGLRVTWIAQDKQMIYDYAETVGYHVKGVQVRLVDDLEAALCAVEQAVRMFDLIVVFAPLAELPTAGVIPPCKQVRRVARAARNMKAATVVVTDGDEELVQSKQVGRAVRFYASTRIRVDKSPMPVQTGGEWRSDYRIVKHSREYRRFPPL